MSFMIIVMDEINDVKHTEKSWSQKRTKSTKLFFYILSERRRRKKKKRVAWWKYFWRKKSDFFKIFGGEGKKDKHTRLETNG